MATIPGADVRRKVVVAPRQVTTSPGVDFLVKFIPAWILSMLLNGGILLLFYFVTLPSATGDDGKLEARLDQKQVLEEADKQPDLTLTDIGLDPSSSTQYEVDKIDTISVPGDPDPTAATGIAQAPESTPRTLPPPPGAGGGTGQALVMPGDFGTGSPFGTPGGLGGIFQPGSFGGRGGATRERLVKIGGGNAISEAAVARGLEWLALHQAPDGHWSLSGFRQHAREKPLGVPGRTFTCNCQGECNRQNDVAATAFGLLPFLAAGQTHRPSAQKVHQDYSKTVAAGLDFLLKKQDKNNGAFSRDMYAHGLAAIVLCEAFGMTSDPNLRGPAQKAIHFIEYAQDPSKGGWRYSPRSDSDTSVTGWELMALKSGQMAGLTVKTEVLQKCDKYLDSCEGNKSAKMHGTFSYTPGGAATPAMTAVGLLCRQYLGVQPRNENLQNGIDYLKKNPPGTSGLYYEYYATQVMHHVGGEAWQFWNLGSDGTGKGGIRDLYIKNQDAGMDPKRAHQIGSWWNPDSDRQGGRIMETSLSLLTLEVYYRHLPLYRHDIGTTK
jgi:hypothetical protein